MRFGTLAVALVCGCAAKPTPAAPPTSAAAPAPVPAAPPAEVEASPSLQPVLDPAPEDPIPKFAQLDVDPDAVYPMRAKVRRDGPLYETRDAPPASPGSGRAVLSLDIVIDPDPDGSPRRPRLLCVSGRHRVAVFRDAADLATTARRGAMIVATNSIPKEPSPLTPGVRLAPGAILEPEAQAGKGVRRVRYEGLFLAAAGWVDANLVDVVYTPAELPDDGVRNGELTRTVKVLDGPRGHKLARIGKAPKVANELLIRTLGPSKNGFVLLRYVEEHAVIVGWVERSAVKAFPEEEVGQGGGGFGLGTAGGERAALTRGTLLVGLSSSEVLGVVTRDRDFSCVDRCDSTEPTVSVLACAGQIAVRAQRPR